jgi:phosphatidylinositol-3-phosphatase
MRVLKSGVVTLAFSLLAGCSGGLETPGESTADNESVAASEGAVSASHIQHVFVIAMENHDANQIIGNSGNAPYINGTLLPKYAHATNFNDELSLSIPSEPHYLWMEAGTNAFSDHTFTGDGAPSSSNSTSNTLHLATQIKNASNGLTWRAYQEGLNGTTGACPIASSGFYAPKHDPFVFFKDVSGNPPSKTNAYCAAHHRAYSALASDINLGDVASYTFITPNLCNDMHGASGCPNSNSIRSGDDWLKAELPRLISYANANAGVIFITWDEGESTLKIPFIAVGPGVKVNYSGGVSYSHSSLVKSIDEILALPMLAKVTAASDLADLFQTGQFP